MNIEDNNHKYAVAKSKRQDHVDAVLKSSSNKKIVVAGPGTGKTYLFKGVLKDKKKSLTLTFINALVEDLSLELCGLSNVKTLHGFARSALGIATKDTVKVFPKLSQVIKEDAKIIMGKEIDFDKLFHNREDENKDIGFYKKRKDYYDKYYGYSDIVFAIVKLFEKNKGAIPAFDQVVVDEFQDFNKLEVSLIDLLAEKSPVLLAGDDDQALYAFKSASPEHIRERHDAGNEDYESFSLPYCSRCTKVVVEAVNDIIDTASNNGHLNKRINKKYLYFEDEGKDKESDDNPTIIYSQIYSSQIPWFIQQRIDNIANKVKGSFSVLIISPTKVKSSEIVKALKNKGFQNIESSEKGAEEGPSLFDGLKILIEEEKSNLGWRIVSKFLLKKDDFGNLLRETEKDNPKNVIDLLNKDITKDVKSMLATARAIKNDTIIDDEKFQDLLKKMGIDPFEAVREQLKEDLIYGSQKGGNPGLRKIPIKATTIQSSKGLAAEYVFITHLDDQYFIKNKDKGQISDQDICNFLVALTRAKKKVFLISSGKNDPTFLKWIEKSRIEKM